MSKRYVWLPPRFIQDRDERGLDTGTVIARYINRVFLELTPDQFDDIEHDAEYQLYHSGAPAGVKKSARATLNIMQNSRITPRGDTP